MQSHTGIIRVFPAIPEGWREAGFDKMRAVGGFLVSADYRNGKVQDITIQSEKGGILKILNPFTNQIEERNTKPGEVIKLTPVCSL